MRAAAWKIYLVAVAAVGTAYFLVPNTPVSKLLLYNGVGLSAVLAILAGTLWNAPADRRPWYLIAIGQTSFLAADVVYYVLEATTGSTPFPSPADLLYVGMYPFVIAGLLRLLRGVSRGRDWASLVDALLVAVATFAVLGVLVIDTYLSDQALSPLGRLISISYPVMDVLVLAVAARLVAGIEIRSPSFGLLVAGLGSLLIADTIYGILNSAGEFQTGGFADAFWLGFYTLLAAAALHPSMAWPATQRPATPGRITLVRLGVLCMVTLAVPLIDLVWGEPFDKVLTTTASMLMFVLVLARLMGLMHTIQAREAQARFDSLHDPLTGLANRVLFNDRLGAALADEAPGVVAVMFIDLDDFKTINDSLGHRAGDQLLEEVSERLRNCVRAGDVVARLGGDEFAVVLSHAVDRQDAVTAAHRVQEALNEPVVLADREVVISASVGIAVEERAGTTVDAMVRSADTAMYAAKEKGKGCFEFFDGNGRGEGVDRLELRRDLQTALERGEFEIYYQPIFDVRAQQVSSVEALLRWNHPTRGVVMPDQFVGMAEQTGLIVPIGQWVLREASAQVHRWSTELSRRLSVAVNLSVRQLHHPGLLEDVAESLRLSGLPPESLTLEITESMLISDAERGARAMEQLKALRVRIAVDDFGTGYSSLSYLRRFPFDTIKIDRSFVRELASSSISEALVRTVITLARSLGMQTVAEGVEHPDQLRVLRRLDCDYGQGFYFSRPVPAAAMEQLLVSPPPRLTGSAVAMIVFGDLRGSGEENTGPGYASGGSVGSGLGGGSVAESSRGAGSGTFALRQATPGAGPSPAAWLPPGEVSGPAAVPSRSGAYAVPPQRGSRASHQPQFEVEVHSGQEALWDLWTSLDELHEATDVPLMARTSWLDVWADVHPEWTPRVLVIRDSDDQLEAAALLARRTLHDRTEIVGMGNSWAARTCFPLRNPAAAQSLAEAIAAEVTGIDGPATLELQQLGGRDRVLPLLKAMLPEAELTQQLPVPRVTFRHGDTLDTLLSRNLRRQLRKAHNRLEQDGVTVDLDFDASLVGLDTNLDTLMQIHRRRDHDAGRASDLDDPDVRRLWREILVRHCRTGQVELALLRFDGVIAAYVIGLLDGASYRVFDGHFDTRFARYSPGRVVEAAALERVSKDTTLHEVDWFSGVAPEKILFSNAVDTRFRLVAALNGAMAEPVLAAGLSGSAGPSGPG